VSAYGAASASTLLISWQEGAHNAAYPAPSAPVWTPDKVCYSARLQGGHDPGRL